MQGEQWEVKAQTGSFHKRNCKCFWFPWTVLGVLHCYSLQLTDGTLLSKRSKNKPGLTQQPQLEQPRRQDYCQRFIYCLCEMKIHPDEAHACALPCGAQTQHKKQQQDTTTSRLYTLTSEDGLQR